MSRPKGSKNKIKKQKNYNLPIRELKKRGRPKGSKNKIEKKKGQSSQIKEKRPRGRPKGSTNIIDSFITSSVYVPYSKSKKNKTGEIITYQCYKSDGVWLIDIFTNDNLTLKGFYNSSVTKLSEATRFIDSEIARL